ncbi:MAG: hypothetical protein WB988_25945 [Candidatus Nitrosopolaris sp.]
MSENDHVIPPAVERMFAKEMNATTISLPSSHASLISHPNETVRSIPVMLIILLQIHYKRSYHEMLGNRQRYQTGMQYLHPRTRSLKRRSVLAVVGRTAAQKNQKKIVKAGVIYQRLAALPAMICPAQKTAIISSCRLTVTKKPSEHQQYGMLSRPTAGHELASDVA